MTHPTVRPMDTRSVSDAELDAFTEFSNRAQSELWPDDPARTPAYWRKQFAGLAELDDWKEQFWLAWDGDRVVARAWAGVPHRDDNQHLMDMSLYVLPEYRRRGLAGQLLGEVAALAETEARSLMIFDSSSRVPAGKAFAEAIGARFGIESHTNQLELTGLDRELLRAWRERGESVAETFDLGSWTGPYPETELEAVCRLIEVMNGEPRGDLEVEDFKVTPKQIRQGEARLARTGLERWTYTVREKGERAFAGYTEVAWRPDDPTLVWQWGTGVRPEYRGHGLGKWLKAVMLEKILNERPEVRFVRTGNADVNAPMLAINRALGFKPYVAHTAWQADLENVRAYLAANNVPQTA